LPSGTSYSFTTVDPPDTIYTQSNGLNDAGQVVGVYRDAGDNTRGYLLSGGTYTILDAPGASLTQPEDINNAGQIVGFYYTDTAHGFLLSGGTYTTIDPPGSTYTYGYGVNDAGQITGSFNDSSGRQHGFLYSGGTCTTIDPPDSNGNVIADGINDSGQIVGAYTGTDGIEHGYLLSGGTYTTIDVPGSSFTAAYGINNAGQIVGQFNTDRAHGYLLSGGTYTTIDVPDSTFNNVAAINATGQIVGSYDDNSGMRHGYFATPDTSGLPSSLSGIVYEDFNNDGQVDFGEQGIVGVSIALTGTDDLGNPVNLSQQTDGDGAYVFLNLKPGQYTITESQPAGYTQGINSVGTGGGTVSGDQFTVSLSAGLNALNYNFGERPAATGAVHSGQTAGIGFWNNKNGQALIKSLNGGNGTELGDWLAATLPHLFGSSSGSASLAGKTNTDVASAFQSRFVVKGQKVDAQVMATALAVYVTNPALNTTGVGTQYGFLIGGDGVGTSTFNVGSNGAAFGVANNTTMTVMDLLLAVDSQARNGVLYNGDALKRDKANNVFGAINQAGHIS
jgi:probable HAF family extracellular repeat protein